MDASSENSVCERIEQAQKGLRQRLFRVGLVGKWHIDNALAIVQAHSVVKRHVALANETEDAAYLEELPELVRKVVEQDARCRQLAATNTEYAAEHRRLVDLLLHFRFLDSFYEHLATHDLKMVVEQASEIATTVHLLESDLRMGIQEFLQLADAIAQDLRMLDKGRAELVAAHEPMALWMADRFSQQRTFPKAGEVAQQQRLGTWPTSPQVDRDSLVVGDALAGLRKAAEKFDHRKGHRFATYAQWWIRQNIVAMAIARQQ